MSYPIEKRWIPGLPKLAYRNGKPEGVLGHSTATPEADAEAEYKYFCREWKNREAFVPYFVDWNKILETADPNFKCWGAGPTANARFIQVELCETKDPAKFRESYKRYVWLLGKIIKDYGFNPDHKKGLWTHFDATHTFHDTNHVDPFSYLASHGVSAEQFINDVENEVRGMGKETFEKGDRGSGVTALQERFKKAGFKIDVDGVFGNQTDAVVRQFQKQYSLVVDGIAGINTLAKLDQILKPPVVKEVVKKTKFKVQVGAFSSRENAQKFAEKVEEEGFETFIVEE